MIDLIINIERNGIETEVGHIIGHDCSDASFKYSLVYLSDGSPISISLPLTDKPYSPEATKNFFEGLLPEGFTRRTVAQWIHVDESDYLSILSELGKECIGAVKVTDANIDPHDECAYEKLSMEQVRELAREGASKSAELITRSHLSLAGATGKAGLYYDESNNEWYLPKGSAPSTHIVKQSHVRLDAIVTNEQLAMLTAKRLKLDVPESFIINTGSGADDDVLFAVKRYDRFFPFECKMISKIPAPRRLHQEDFAQALGIAANSKYEKHDEKYMKSLFDLLRKYSADPISDQLKLWDMIVFDYLVGNTDAHIKNFSLVYSPNLKSIRLAPCYDLISTTVYKSSTRDMAFKIGGVYDIGSIGRSAFVDAAKDVGIGVKLAMKHFDALADGFKTALSESADELASCGFESAPQIKDKIFTTGGISNI